MLAGPASSPFVRRRLDPRGVVRKGPVHSTATFCPPRFFGTKTFFFPPALFLVQILPLYFSMDRMSTRSVEGQGWGKVRWFVVCALAMAGRLHEPLCCHEGVSRRGGIPPREVGAPSGSYQRVGPGSCQGSLTDQSCHLPLPVNVPWGSCQRADGKFSGVSGRPELLPSMYSLILARPKWSGDNFPVGLPTQTTNQR